jgi:hypothetical protein
MRSTREPSGTVQQDDTAPEGPHSRAVVAPLNAAETFRHQLTIGRPPVSLITDVLLRGNENRHTLEEFRGPSDKRLFAFRCRERQDQVRIGQVQGAN